MHVPCKPLCFFVIASCLHLLPFTLCSELKEVNHFGSLKIRNDNFYKVSPQKRSDIAFHGIVLWMSMGLLMPLGILAIRMSNREEAASTRSRALFYLHIAFQILSVLLAIVGAAVSLKKFENSFDNNHQRLGLALYVAVLLQAFIGVFRPHRGKKERSYWYLIHWLLGTLISLVGIINIYTGLRAYHKRTLKSTSLWTILFTAQVSFIALAYLFQDKLEYIKRQAVILGGHDQSSSIVSSNQHSIPQTQNPKELIPQACGKRNALGNLFD